MKHLNKLFVAALMALSLNAQAQDEDNPWSIGFGVNAVTTRFGASADFTDNFNKYFKVSEWNILPSVSYINVSRHIGNNFSVGVTGSVNKIDELYLDDPANTHGILRYSADDLTYYGADAIVKYSILPKSWFNPFVHIGGGYTWLDEQGNGTVNGGLGINFWFTENVGLTVQSTYKHSFENQAEANVPRHMEHFAGLTFEFGR